MMQLDLESSIRLACLVEATARKPGNVHPGAHFDDLRYEDFVKVAGASAAALAKAETNGIGRSVLEAIVAARACTPGNVNLGISLLIAPLAAVPADTPLVDGVAGVLDRTTREDARLVYEAIRLASPGGLGRVEREDVAEEPTVTLTEAMSLAAGRDRVARQYAARFEDVLVFGVSTLNEWMRRRPLETAVIGLAIAMIARWSDSLIARKCGMETAHRAQELANAVMDTGWPDEPGGQTMFEEFDAWLRGDGHRRNPGTTADLVAATFFAAIRDKKLSADAAWEFVQTAG
jgi:triphosphoribosyl-dephospho-CoA synthase